MAITAFAAAIGLTRFAIIEVDHWGGGLFPALCILIAVLLAVAGVGVLFRRAGELVLRAGLAILDIFSSP